MKQAAGRQTVLVIIAVVTLLCCSRAVSDSEADLVGLLNRGDHFLIMRHALAPGYGDPDHFEVNDCATQRNLSDHGRDQARAIGERLRRNGIARAQVWSSQWCRCVETARLLQLGPVLPLPALNSFFQQPARRASQMADLRRWLKGQSLAEPLILVTHQVVITALTGMFPDSGEAVLVSRTAGGELRVVDTVKTAIP